MFLKKECDELGEWFADTYPSYTLTIKCKAEMVGVQPREYYGIRVEGPEGFDKQSNLYFDRGKGLEEKVRESFVVKMQRAISEAIDPPDIAVKEFKMFVPA